MNPTYKRTQLSQFSNTAVQSVTSGVEALCTFNNTIRNDLSLATNFNSGQMTFTIQYNGVYKLIAFTYVYGVAGTMTDAYISIYRNGTQVSIASSKATAQLNVTSQYVRFLSAGDVITVRALVSGSSPTISDRTTVQPYTQTSLTIINIS